MPWTWEIQKLRTGKWELCLWATPSKDALLKGHKPSPEARPVYVRFERGRKRAEEAPDEA